MLNRKPRKGDEIYFDTFSATGDIIKLNKYLGTVTNIKGNLCYIKDKHNDKTTSFIWQMQENNKMIMNKLAKIGKN